MKTILVKTMPGRHNDQVIEFPPFDGEFDEDVIDWGASIYTVPDEIFDRFVDALDNDPICESYKVLKTVTTAAELGRKGGQSTSAAKRKASAANGKLGGRPKKTTE